MRAKIGGYSQGVLLFLLKIMEKEPVIAGGATLWARQTVTSEIFLTKPDKWFKIWFYLVNRVSHKDTKQYKRGEIFLQTEWIGDATGATPDQIKKCLRWLRDSEMISTRRSTRGFWLYLPKYSHFQTLDNYYSGVKAPDEAPEKHQRSTPIQQELKELNTTGSFSNENSPAADKSLSLPSAKKKERKDTTGRDSIITAYREQFRYITGENASIDTADYVMASRVVKQIPMDKILEMIIWYVKMENQQFIKYPSFKSIFTAHNINQFKLRR